MNNHSGRRIATEKELAQKILKMYDRIPDVCEMSTLYPQRTLLSRPLWIDDLGEVRSLPHSPYRLRVQARRGEPFNTRSNAVIIYFDKEEPYVDPKNRAKHDITGRELKAIKTFIKDNLDLLKKFYTHAEGYDAAWLTMAIAKRRPFMGGKGDYCLIVEGERHYYATKESKISAKRYWTRQGARVVDPVPFFKKRQV